MFPSPNVQLHEVGALEDKSVNVTVNGAMPSVGVPVKSATGVTAAAVTLIKVTWDERADPALLDAFSTMEKFPVPNVCAGFWTVLHDTSVLLPVTFLNDQFHAVGEPVEVSLNCTASGAVPLVTFAVKLAAGAGILTLMNTG